MRTLEFIKYKEIELKVSELNLPATKKLIEHYRRYGDYKYGDKLNQQILNTLRIHREKLKAIVQVEAFKVPAPPKNPQKHKHLSKTESARLEGYEQGMREGAELVYKIQQESTEKRQRKFNRRKI